MTGSPPARRPIRRLAPATVERIAAGEVVERPASVVKELVENAIDAGARQISVRLEGAGLARIEVADDGTGILPEELPLALERHATSKLDPEGPVERIDSLGFRGEALASIAAVARVRLASRPSGQEAAEGITIAPASPAQRFVAARAPGTSVEVRDLFFATPARRKFLRRAPAEQLEVVRTLERIYLARPDVTLRVESEGRPLAAYPASASLTDAAAHVLGPAIRREHVAISAAVPGGRVDGILGRPSTASASSAGLYLAVNGRPVVSRPIAQSVRAAFGDALPRTRFPVGVLHLALDPERVDANVHPTKREVRFADERALLDALRVAARAALVAVSAPSEVSDRQAPPVPTARPGPAVRRSSPSVAVQSRLEAPAEPAAAERTAGPTARWRLLGCVDALYWIADSGDGLWVIDQHAASERVLYDALLRSGRLERQALLEPVPLRLSGAQRATLESEPDAVRAAGFEVEPFGPETFLVRAVPAYRGRSPRPDALLGLLDELADGGRATTVDGVRERRAATIACHAAIRAGDPVDPVELRRVLEALYALPGPTYACPHGRPAVLAFSRSRLDRWFLRSGP